MEYINTCKAAFLERPNRFIASARLSDSGVSVVCHVKNTGRCRELLLPGSQLVLEHHPGALKKGRKTEYSLICVYKERAGFSGQTPRPPTRLPMNGWQAAASALSVIFSVRLNSEIPALISPFRRTERSILWR